MPLSISPLPPSCGPPPQMSRGNPRGHARSSWVGVRSTTRIQSKPHLFYRHLGCHTGLTVTPGPRASLLYRGAAIWGWGKLRDHMASSSIAHGPFILCSKNDPSMQTQFSGLQRTLSNRMTINSNPGVVVLDRWCSYGRAQGRNVSHRLAPR